MKPQIGQKFIIMGEIHTCTGYAEDCYAVSEDGKWNHFDFITELIPVQ